MRQSAKLVFKHIEAEIRAGIPSDKVILGGFSQGTLRHLVHLDGEECYLQVLPWLSTAPCTTRSLWRAV